MDPLTELAIKYGSDKWGKHSYTPYYYELFKNSREKVRKVVEIGIGEGAGLMMWRDFFPNAKIYGIDNKGSLLLRRNRIESFLCDQTNKQGLLEIIDKIGSDIDVVIDDGSHIPYEQVFTCQTLMPHLDKNVTYVIEDVADPDIKLGLKNFNIDEPKLNHKKSDTMTGL